MRVKDLLQLQIVSLDIGKVSLNVLELLLNPLLSVLHFVELSLYFAFVLGVMDDVVFPSALEGFPVLLQLTVLFDFFAVMLRRFNTLLELRLEFSDVFLVLFDLVC